MDKTAEEKKTISDRIWEIVRNNTDERTFGCINCDKDESHLVIEDMTLLRVGIENLIEKEIISPYNLAHLELGGDCCGVFNILDGNGIIRCNECRTTIHEAIQLSSTQQLATAREGWYPRGFVKETAWLFSGSMYVQNMCGIEDLAKEQFNRAFEIFWQSLPENKDRNTKMLFWNDNKVIDFVNYYIKLHKLPFRYTLENQTIIDTFKDLPENKKK